MRAGLRSYMAWRPTAALDGDPLTEPGARDGAVRGYRAHLHPVQVRRRLADHLNIIPAPGWCQVRHVRRSGSCTEPRLGLMGALAFGLTVGSTR